MAMGMPVTVAVVMAALMEEIPVTVAVAIVPSGRTVQHTCHHNVAEEAKCGGDDHDEWVLNGLLVDDTVRGLIEQQDGKSLQMRHGAHTHMSTMLPMAPMTSERW